MANKLALVSRIPDNPVQEAGKYITAKNFNDLSFWEQMDEKQQAQLITESQELAGAVMLHGSSRLAMGEHLSNIQDMLLPFNGAWEKFLRSFKFNISRATAFRYISGFKNAQKRLPPNVVRAAMVRGMDILGHTDKLPLGVFTNAVKRLKPPPNPTPAQAEKYLDELQATRDRQRAREKAKGVKEDPIVDIEVDPRFLQMQAFRLTKNSLMKLNSRSRRKWLAELTGMLMEQIGVKDETSYSPVTPPEEFLMGRGRPKAPELVVEGEPVAAVG